MVEDKIQWETAIIFQFVECYFRTFAAGLTLKISDRVQNLQTQRSLKRPKINMLIKSS